MTAYVQNNVRRSLTVNWNVTGNGTQLNNGKLNVIHGATDKNAAFVKSRIVCNTATTAN